jgi:hydroxyjasmonate sulfotransferase
MTDSTTQWNVECTENENGVNISCQVVASLVSDPEQKHSYSFQKVNATPHLNSCNQERWNDLDSKIKYKKSDIIICTYPKCGTTWTEQCVLLLLNGGNETLLDPSHKNIYQPGSQTIGKLWPEAQIEQNPDTQLTAGLEFAPISWEQFDAVPEPRVIKSHATRQLLLGCNGQGLAQIPEGVKVLVVTRNPLDACVSSYYHAFNPFKSGWPFAAWAALWLAGFPLWGSYFHWVRDWFQDVKAYPEKAIWLQYEDMQKDPAAEVEKIAQFLGIPVTPDVVANVVRLSSFDSMKAQAAAKGGDHSNHLRQGKSGDWKNHFSSAIVQEFRDQFNADLADSGVSYSVGADAEKFEA